MLWDQEEIQLKVLHVHKQFIHASVISAGDEHCKFTAVYTSPRVVVRSFLWGDLNKVEAGGPWVILGDFNCVLKGRNGARAEGCRRVLLTGWTRGGR